MIRTSIITSAFLFAGWISASAVTITRVQVQLELSGSFNGDLYVYLSNEAWENGAAIYNGSPAANANPDIPILANCILYGNTITPVANGSNIGQATANNLGVYEVIHTPPAGTIYYRTAYS